MRTRETKECNGKAIVQDRDRFQKEVDRHREVVDQTHISTHSLRGRDCLDRKSHERGKHRCFAEHG